MLMSFLTATSCTSEIKIYEAYGDKAFLFSVQNQIYPNETIQAKMYYRHRNANHHNSIHESPEIKLSLIVYYALGNSNYETRELFNKTMSNNEYYALENYVKSERMTKSNFKSYFDVLINYEDLANSCGSIRWVNTLYSHDNTLFSYPACVFFRDFDGVIKMSKSNKILVK